MNRKKCGVYDHHALDLLESVLISNMTMIPSMFIIARAGGFETRINVDMNGVEGIGMATMSQVD